MFAAGMVLFTNATPPQFGSAGAGLNYTTTTTWNHDITGDFGLVFGLSYHQGANTGGYPPSGNAPVVTASIGGQSATMMTPRVLVGVTYVYVNPVYYTRTWWLTAFSKAGPLTGTQTVAYTSGQGSTPNRYNANSVAYKGVISTGTLITGTGTTISVPSSSAGVRYVAAFANVTGTNFTGFNQSVRHDGNYLLIGDAVGNGGTLDFSVAQSGGAIVVPLLIT